MLKNYFYFLLFCGCLVIEMRLLWVLDFCFFYFYNQKKYFLVSIGVYSFDIQIFEDQFSGVDDDIGECWYLLCGIVILDWVVGARVSRFRGFEICIFWSDEDREENVIKKQQCL